MATAQIMMLEEDFEDGTMRISVYLPQEIKRLDIVKRGNFMAARTAIRFYGGVDTVQLQMDWYGGRDAFTPAEQDAFQAAFHDFRTIVAAG